MTILSSLIGSVENSNPNPVTAVDFQQGRDFITQYGEGQAGFNNYVSQVLANNPSITLGDFYGQYNTNTGTPGSGATVGSLGQDALSNLTNKAEAMGLSLETPVADIAGSVPANGASNPFSFTCENCGGTTGTTDTNTDAFGNDTTSAISSSSGGSVSPSTGSAASPTGAPAAPTGFFPALIDAQTSLFSRAMLIIFGLVLIAGGAYVVARGDPTGIVSTAQG